MFRKIALLTSAALVAGSFAMAVPAHAAGVDGTGTIGTCTFSGKASISPPLTMGGTKIAKGTKVSGKISNCTGGTGDGAKVASGSVMGTIQPAAPGVSKNDCGALASAGLNSFTLTIKWKAVKGGPKLNATTVNIAATAVGSGGINLAGPGGSLQFTLSGTNASGSFSGGSTTATTTTDQTLTDFLTGCNGKGVKGFSFTNKLGPSTITG